MLKKISFTPDHTKYDMLEWLYQPLSKTDVSLNFIRELRTKHDIDRLAELFVLPLNSILRFEEYKATDIHYLLNSADKLGIQFGSLPDWLAEVTSKNELARMLRFLHLKLNRVAYSASPSLIRDQLNFLKDNLGIERVYQFLLLDKTDPQLSDKAGKKILDSHDYFIVKNELENLKITISSKPGTSTSDSL